MESSLYQGKPLNSEQLDVLRSKPSVVSSLDDLEKLRPSLVSALQEEFALSQQQPPSLPSLPPETSTAASETETETDITDLIHLLYFGTIFTVSSQGDYTSTMLTRIHERSCCVTYDYVTDDDDRPLSDRDLDLIASLSRFLVSRPKDSGLSHEKALRDCLERAKLWLFRSNSPIDPVSNVTYAALRERLNKIMSLEYFTRMPEMKAPVEVAAAAAGGNYASFQVQESFVPVQIEGFVGQVEQKGKPRGRNHRTKRRDRHSRPLKTENSAGNAKSSAFHRVISEGAEACCTRSCDGRYWNLPGRISITQCRPFSWHHFVLFLFCFAATSVMSATSPSIAS